MPLHKVASSGPIRTVQLDVNPIVTQLVLGTPQARVFPGMQIAPPIKVDNFVFKYTQYGNEHLRDIDTERALGAPRSSSNWTASTVEAQLKRYGHEIPKDVDEIGNAHPSMRIQERSALLSKRMVDLNIERVIRDTLLEETQYAAANIITVGGGSEWDTASGDVKANVDSAVDAILDGTPLQREDLVIFMPRQCWEAAKKDSTYLAARQNTTTDAPTLESFTRYLDIGRIDVANPIEQPHGTTSPQPMYTDTCVVYYPGGASPYDDAYGDLTYAVTFKLDRGRASTPYYDEHITSWRFPWDDNALPKVINPSVGALIKNCVA